MKCKQSNFFYITLFFFIFFLIVAAVPDSWTKKYMALQMNTSAWSVYLQAVGLISDCMWSLCHSDWFMISSGDPAEIVQQAHEHMSLAQSILPGIVNMQIAGGKGVKLIWMTSMSKT